MSVSISKFVEALAIQLITVPHICQILFLLTTEMMAVF